MAKLVYGLQQSLDGYVDHQALERPGPALFRHFLEHVAGLAGVVYGRRTYAPATPRPFLWIRTMGTKRPTSD